MSSLDHLLSGSGQIPRNEALGRPPDRTPVVVLDAVRRRHLRFHDFIVSAANTLPGVVAPAAALSLPGWRSGLVAGEGIESAPVGHVQEHEPGERAWIYSRRIGRGK